MSGVIELPGPQDLLPAYDDQDLIVGQAQHLVRRQQPPPAQALGVTVLGNDLGKALLVTVKVVHWLSWTEK